MATGAADGAARTPVAMRSTQAGVVIVPVPSLSAVGGTVEDHARRDSEEDRVAEDVALPEPTRFDAEAKEPLEAAALQPDRGLCDGACRVIECRSHACHWDA